jgi:tetratricopeptide (TPR) repeat protein
VDRAKAQYYLDFAEKFKLVLAGPKVEEATERLEAVDKELRGALAWFIDDNETDKALLLASILWRFWIDKGHVEEGRKLTTRLLEQPHEKRTTTLGEVLCGAGMLAFRQDDNKEAEKLFQESLIISRENSDNTTIVRALTGLARIALRQVDYAKVKTRSEEARRIARSVGDEYSETRPLHMLAAATKMEGDLARARILYEESLALARKLGDTAMESTELDNLGTVALQMGDLKQAKHHYRQAGQLMYKIRSKYLLPYMPLHFSAIALSEGKLDRAVKLLGASEALFESSGMIPDPDETVERDRAISSLRKAVDENKFNRLWAEGRKLSLDHTVQYSLET